MARLISYTIAGGAIYGSHALWGMYGVAVAFIVMVAIAYGYDWYFRRQ